MKTLIAAALLAALTIPAAAKGPTIYETYTTGTAKIIEIVPEGEDGPPTVISRRPPVPCGGFGIVTGSGAGTQACIRVEVVPGEQPR